MSEELNKIVIDCSTGDEQIIPLTPEEISEREAEAAAFAVLQEERAAADAASLLAKESAQAKLSALGLTSEEISALYN